MSNRPSLAAPPSADLIADGLNSLSLGYVEERFADYQANPAALPADWREYFAGWNGAAGAHRALPAQVASPAPTDAGKGTAGNGAERRPTPRVGGAVRQERLDDLIRNYRVRGHIVANVDPLDRERPLLPELDPAYYGFTPEDQHRVFSTRAAQGPNRRTLREVVAWLRNTYCRSIGVQYMHIDDLAVRQWLQDRMEGTENRLALSRDEQLRILGRLTDAVVFERFVQAKFTGAKSFSLEGGESLIPLLDLAIEKAGEDGVDEIVLAMAHRGRLNVLANIIGKSAREIFREFLDRHSPERTGPGDVKYHLGYSSDWRTESGRNVHLSLCFNPSHLEFVNPVALGRVRAKQDRFGDAERRRGLAVLIHGDAAFAGEGVSQETLNLSELAGYRTGGSLHVVVNNQIGFTTTPTDARSSIYATDVAKLLQIPIFHVNGEDPEAVAQVVRLSLDFRKEFQRDAVIDMYCYRLRGHNEGDEPSFTQPRMYDAIVKRPPVRDTYLAHLTAMGGVSKEDAARIEADRRAKLEEEFQAGQSDNYVLTNPTATGVWANYFGGPESQADRVDTAVERDVLVRLLERLAETPAGFHPHPKLRKFLERRRAMAAGEELIDWSTAEALAMASLAVDGYRIRLSGQDSERGTFSQRHAVLHDVETGKTFMPLAHLAADQAPVEVINSPLSEAGVMGFDYGYSLDWPDGLVMWEAQFGDFVNAGQVVIDQFMASAEAKWRRLSGIVLLLPHGYEGQGPEHSSARLERFLALSAQDNIQVAYPTTPAQYFHLLRRQALRRWRKPLVIMTPKSLLRRRECTSTLGELARGRFRNVKAEAWSGTGGARRVLLCTGKVYYDLAEQRAEMGGGGPAILRLEQLYPLPAAELRAALAPFGPDVRATWVQEEPENMGAWNYVWRRWTDCGGGRGDIAYVGRPASASPGSGSKSAHDREQAELVERALAPQGNAGA